MQPFTTLMWLFLLWPRATMSQTGVRNYSTELVPIYQPYLSTLKSSTAKFNPNMGGLDWNMCCSLVVNESLMVENDRLYIRPGQTFFTGTIETLEEFPRYPCGATYNGTLNAPHQEFWVPYSWCYTHCPGWPVISSYDFDKWLKPMIAFILPSLIFCLNIPRRRRLDLPVGLFSNKSISISNIPLIALKIPLAAVIITFDVLIWTCVVFSVAGPMLTSGTYEALIDARVLSYLEGRTNENSLTVQQRAHTLLSILIGNLDVDAWQSSNLFVQGLPRNTTRRSNDVQKRRRVVIVKHKLRAMLDSQLSFGSSVGAPVMFYIASYIWSVYEVRAELGS